MNRRTGGEGDAGNELALGVALDATKRYAASIVKDPKACPMFPPIREHNGLPETFCYMQGYLAGFISALGEAPSKERMDDLATDMLNDPNVRDIALGMQEFLQLPLMINPPREF